MKEIDWAKFFDCAVFAALMVMCIIVTAIIIGSVVHLVGLYGLALIALVFLLFIGLMYCAYKYNIV